MRTVCVLACDVTWPGKGLVADRTRALFAGQEYDLPAEAEVDELVATGALLLLDAPVNVPADTDWEATPDVPVPATRTGRRR